MIHKIRGAEAKQEKVLEWYLEIDDGNLVLRCNPRELANRVLLITKSGKLYRHHSVNGDLGLCLDDEERIVTTENPE